jgi:hypothetical protein
MSAPSESSGTPVVRTQPVPVRNSVARESTENFKKKLFAKGVHYEERFRKICDAGCPSEEFGQLLWATCMLMSLRSIPLINGGNLSKAQLKSLPKRLRALAAIIKALNGTPLAPGNEVNFMPYAPDGTRARDAREYLVMRYEMLPGMLIVYSYHLERFSKIARDTRKRLTAGHVSAIQIVHYVENRTGSPRYADLAELLEQGCLIEGREQDCVPKFLTTEGLAKLYQRWGSDVIGPTNRQDQPSRAVGKPKAL